MKLPRLSAYAKPIAGIAFVAFLAGWRVVAANIGDIFNTSATDLSVGTNYASTITPTSAFTTDLQFSGTYTNPTALTVDGAGLNFGSLDDITTTALTISNTSGTAGSITLSGGGNSTPGSNPA